MIYVPLVGLFMRSLCGVALVLPGVRETDKKCLGYLNTGGLAKTIRTLYEDRMLLKEIARNASLASHDFDVMVHYCKLKDLVDSTAFIEGTYRS